MIYRLFWRGMWQQDFSARDAALDYIVACVDDGNDFEDYEILDGSDFL